MKDLNELLQAILDMDAAQRKATEDAKAERTNKLAQLEVQKRAIADECDAKAQQAGKQAAEKAAAENQAALDALQQRKEQAARRMTEEAAARHDAWVSELVDRTLRGEA